MNFDIRSPVITKKRKVITYEYDHIYLRDFLDYEFYKRLDRDISVKKYKIYEEAKYKIQYGEEYKKYREKYEECIDRGIRLIIQHEKEKTRVSFQRFRRPRKINIRYFSDFLKMREYRQKNGLLQQYYDRKIAENHKKRRDAYDSYPFDDLQKERKEIKERLEKLKQLSLLSERTIEQQLEEIKLEGKLNEIDNRLAELNKIIKGYIESALEPEERKIIEEEKNQIKTILLEIQNYTDLKYEITVNSTYPSFDQRDYDTKLNVIENEIRNRYFTELGEYLSQFQNWEEIYNSKEDIAQIQSHIDSLKKKYNNEIEKVNEKLSLEIDSALVRNYQYIDEAKKLIEKSLPRVIELSNYFLEKLRAYTII